jgi:hypothetical protein
MVTQALPAFFRIDSSRSIEDWRQVGGDQHVRRFCSNAD